MTKPSSLTTSDGRKSWPVVTDDNVGHYSRGVGEWTPTSADDKTAHLGVATHLAGDAVGATDPVVLLGAVDDAGDAAPVVLDAAGALPVAEISRVNTAVSILASAERTTTQTQADQTNLYHRGIRVVLDVTVNGAGGSITLEIDAKDAVSGKYVPLLTGAAVTDTRTVTFLVYPSAAAVANLAVSDVLPLTWRVLVTANNANAVTYSVGAVLLV